MGGGMMRNLILAVVVAGLAAGTAVAAGDAAPTAAADKPAAAADKPAPPEGWHGDRFGPGPHGVTVHRGEGPQGGGWSDSDGNRHRYGEWHGGGPGYAYGGPRGWSGWGGPRPDYSAYPHGYNVQIIPGNYAYRRFVRGGTVPPLWRDDRFYVREWFAFRLTEPPYGHRWIRYYNDALLINVTTGVVTDVMPDVDWTRAYMPPRSWGPGYGYGPGYGWSGYHYGWIMPASSADWHASHWKKHCNCK
jgi:Ni/Co efflux regulator RcnB